jgi:hypothetical protein
MSKQILHVDVHPLLKCYAGEWSYGEICVGCNCCGRINKETMYKARIKFHKEMFERKMNFSRWFKGSEWLQRANSLYDMKYHLGKIIKYQKKVSYEHKVMGLGRKKVRTVWDTI